MYCITKYDVTLWCNFNLFIVYIISVAIYIKVLQIKTNVLFTLSWFRWRTPGEWYRYTIMNDGFWDILYIRVLNGIIYHLSDYIMIMTLSHFCQMVQKSPFNNRVRNFHWGLVGIGSCFPVGTFSRTALHKQLVIVHKYIMFILYFPPHPCKLSSIVNFFDALKNLYDQCKLVLSMRQKKKSETLFVHEIGYRLMHFMYT